jgi:hypothetical protein
MVSVVLTANKHETDFGYNPNGVASRLLTSNAEASLGNVLVHWQKKWRNEEEAASL